MLLEEKLFTGLQMSYHNNRRIIKKNRNERKPKEKSGKLWAVNKENDNLKHDTRQILSFCAK